MKTQLCDLYRHCFLTETGPCDPPQHLSTSLQERAQAMVQCVSLPLLCFFFSQLICRVKLLSIYSFVPQRKTDGLEGFPAGEEQEKHHHGVISCPLVHFLLSHPQTQT